MFELKVVRERRAGYGASTRIRDAKEVVEAFKAHFAPLDREQFVVRVMGLEKFQKLLRGEAGLLQDAVHGAAFDVADGLVVAGISGRRQGARR